MSRIIPAILATIEQQFKEQVEAVDDYISLLDDWVHIDFMDNIFVPNQSIDLSIIQKYPTLLKKEAHLMVQEPIKMMPQLIKLGFDRIIVHLEATGITELIELFHSPDLSIGLAINPETPLERAQPFINQIDELLIMGVHPGSQQQQFLPEVINKIKAAAEMDVIIGVDGGITLENVTLITGSGATNLCIGSHLFQGDVKQNIQAFKQATAA